MTSRPASVHSLTASNNGGGGGTATPATPPTATTHGVDVLLLGSGWTSSFLLPELHKRRVSLAYTNRSGVKPDSYAVPQHPIKWTCPDGSESRLQWRKALKLLPDARLVVVVFALKDSTAAKELVLNYEALVAERGNDVRPRWCILGSTGNWGPGIHTSSSPVTSPSPRSLSEDAVLAATARRAIILNLAGLYGGSTRHPINWLSKVAGSQEKLAAKASLHLVHGDDVARAVIAVWQSVANNNNGSGTHPSPASLWGRRWIVTDGRVYDWWQLATQLPTPATTRKQYEEWVTDLRKEYGITSLPRPVADPLVPSQQPPHFLERALSSTEFWDVIDSKPSRGPAYETDIPISPLDGLPVSTAQSASTAKRNDTSTSTALSPFTPTVSKARLDDLVACLKHEIAREERFPIPPVFEGRKQRFGLTQKRFLALRKNWLAFLTNTASSPHDKTWASHWREITSYHHGFYPLPDLLTGKHSQGTLDGLHFVRVSPSAETASQRRVVPLAFLHGWPGSFLEGLAIAKPLANPGPETPLSTPAFDVVIPSHPGYAWSGSPVVHEDPDGNNVTSVFSGPDGDILVKDVADLVDKLMVEMGFGSSNGGYVVQAGDWGSGVARSLGVHHRDNVRSIHLNFIPSPPPLLHPPLIPDSVLSFLSTRIPSIGTLTSLPRWIDRYRFAESPSSSSSAAASSAPASLSRAISALFGLPKPLSENDAAKVARGLEFQTSGSAYAQFHGTRPGTLGEVMHYSPSALLAWIGEKFIAWTDQDPPDDEILASLTLWWVTDTMPRSLLAYRNRPLGRGLQEVAGQPENFIHVPVGYSDFPFELVPTPLEWAKGTANLVFHRQHDSGGHFAALEKPVELVADIREFFRKHA